MIWATRLISLLALAASFPLSWAEGLDEWNPKIEYPHNGVVWHAGEHHSVKWDTSNAPEHITNIKGEIRLVRNGQIHNTLANGFDVRDGHVEIQVPSVETGEYQLDLFGDSGNWSERFRIISQ